MNTNEVVNKDAVLNLQNAFGSIPERFKKVIHDTLNSLGTNDSEKKLYAECKHPVRNKRKSPRK